MRLVTSRPVTIHAVRNAQRWFPAVYRHTDNSLLMYQQCGYDADFSPLGRWRSLNGGRTWHEEEENLPRSQIAHSFADGTLLELDAYGFHDPASPGTFCYYGAWSRPGTAVDEAGASAFYRSENHRGEDWLGESASGVSRRIFRLHSPSLAPMPLANVSHGYPHHPWWPLINHLHPPDVGGEDVLLGGPHITDTAEAEGKLLAVGYGSTLENGERSRGNSVFCYESTDRGLTWKEISRVALGNQDTPEGFNETSLVVLNDGRLYCVIRSGNFLFHNWSEDCGRNWTQPRQLTLIDSSHEPRMVWPRCARLTDGTLVLAYGRPGKHLIFDPTGTGENWQGHLDLHAWELETQEMMGVPPAQRLRGDTNACERYWDSGDYLSVVPIGEREMLVTYDVQNFVENWNSIPVAGVRMVRVRLED